MVIDCHDASKERPIGGINIPLYEVTPDKRTKIKKLLNEPEKVRFHVTQPWLNDLSDCLGKLYAPTHVMHSFVLASGN